MLFDEKEMLDICQKYGIPLVEKEGYPLYMGEEMNENFSVEKMMHESCQFAYSEKVMYKESINLSLSVHFDKEKTNNNYSSAREIKINIAEDNKYGAQITSSIPCNSDNKFAA